jgi:hypothetical protein
LPRLRPQLSAFLKPLLIGNRLVDQPLLCDDAGIGRRQVVAKLLRMGRNL